MPDIETIVHKTLGESVEIIDYSINSFDSDNVYYFAVIKHDERKRILAVKYNKGGEICVIANNEYAVLQKDEGGVYGDPYDGIKVENNQLIMMFYGGSAAYRWRRIFYFNISNDNIVLSRYIYYYFSANVDDMTDEESILKSEGGHARVINYDNCTVTDKKNKNGEIVIEEQNIDKFVYKIEEFNINEFKEKFDWE